MLFGNTKQVKDKKSFYELKEDNKQDNSVIGNQTEQQFLTNPEENLQMETKTEFESAMDSIQEYNIVKQMLINNSLPINERVEDQKTVSRKMVIDKKILLNLLVDLQRFRKLLNLKKSFYIFNISYDGKPQEMAKWHQKVEVRVTQTFKQLNIRRLIEIIGYDPSAYFKGEMSYDNLNKLKKGQIDKVSKIEETYRHENLGQNMH